jgi:EpsI family protein
VFTLPSFSGCTGPDQWEPAWQPTYVDSDWEKSGTYDCAGYRMSIWAAGYFRQEQGRELISSSNRVWPKEWRRYAQEKSLVVSLRSGPMPVQEVQVDDPRQTILIWYWFKVGETMTTSKWRVKFEEALNALKLRSVPASVFAVAVEPGTDSPEFVREQLEAKLDILVAE